MNERIRQLVRESHIDVYGLGKDHAKWEATLERFAELIVRECAQLILDKKMGDLGDNPGVKEWEEGYNEAVYDCYYLIRKHFGVEE